MPQQPWLARSLRSVFHNEFAHRRRCFSNTTCIEVCMALYKTFVSVEKMWVGTDCDKDMCPATDKDNCCDPSCSRNSALKSGTETDSRKLGLLEGSQNIASDNTGDIRCTLYNTLRLNDLESFIALQNKWHCEFADKPDIMGVINVILPQVYEELKLKNVEMSSELQFAIESEIIDQSFVTEVNKNSKQVHRPSLADVKERIEMTVVFVDGLTNYMNGNNEIDQEFLLTARLLCQNIHILKRKLRSTYNQLPWEEMEFVVANFIAMHMSLESNIVYKLVLTKRRLLTHLNGFALQLSKVELQEADVDSKFPKQKYSHLSPRESMMKDVVTKCQQFKALYSDFNQIKDIYSLRRIESYIDLALAVDLEGKGERGKLVIERALQVIGESLKNTIESPHMSYAVHRALIVAAPRNVREIVTLLRDSLSHSHTLRKKMELEGTEDSEFFLEVQNDLKKVRAEISVILYKQKTKITRSFLQETVQRKNEEDFKTVISSLSDSELGELDVEDECFKEIENIKRLLTTLEDFLKDKTKAEIVFFKEMEKLLKSYTSRKKKAQSSYLTELSSLADVVRKLEKKYDFETVCEYINLNVVKSNSFFKPLLLEKIVSLVDEFSRDCNPSGRYSETKTKRKIDELLYQVRSSVVFGATRVKGIDSFKQNLEVNEDPLTLAENEINSLVQQVEEQLDSEEKAVFQQEFRNSKEKYNAKLMLSALFADLIDGSVTKDKGTVDSYTDLGHCLCLKKLHDNFEMCNWNKCKSLVDNTRSSYQTLLNSVKNTVDSQKLLDIPKTFGDFCRSFINKNVVIKLEEALKMIVQFQKEQHEKYFERRLKVLEELLPVSCESKFEFVAHYVKDNTLQAAVEMLVLDLLEVLNEVSELPDNIMCIDNCSPVLVGKCLRNYLAHGNILVEVLPCVPSIGIVSNALKLVQDKTLFTNCAAKKCQIGSCITENINDLRIRVARSSDIVKNQKAMFSAATRGDVEMIQGSEIRGRDIKNWTGLHFAVAGDSVEALKFFHGEGLVDNVKDMFERTPLHVAAIKISCKAMRYLMQETNSCLNSSDRRCMTPLHYASVNGCQDIVEILLNNGVEVDARSEENMTPLHFAAGKGHLAIVSLLIKNRANINAVNYRYVTPLHLAASYGHKDVVSYLLTMTKKGNICSSSKTTPLHFAACSGHKEVVEVLLTNGAKVNAMTRDGTTPLHIASGEDVVHQLIQSGAKVNVPTTNYHFTPLHCAASSGRVNEVGVLLAAGAWVDGHKHCDWTPLHTAVSTGSEDMVDTLLRYKADINATGESNWTPLHLTAYNGHSKLVAPLLANGTNIDATSSTMQTPLHLATLQGHRSTVEALVDGKADTYAIDDDGKTPLHYVAGVGYADLVEILLLKTNIDIEDGDKDTPLSLSAGQGHKNVVEILLKHGAHVGASIGSKTKWTPLHYAAGNGHTDIVERLCLHKADVDAVTNYGVTPLHLAAQHCHKDIVEILLKAGARVDAQTVYCATPLHYATNNGHKEIIEVLLSSDADVNATDDDDMAALHLSVQMGFRDTTEVLLKRGALVNARSSGGDTPLHLASTHDHADVMEVLLKTGANVNALTDAKWTPLHYAAHENRKHAVRMLLAKEADPNIATKSLSTPLHMASCNGHAEVVDELLNYNVLTDLPDDVGWTPLHLTATKGFERIATALLEKGASANVSDKGGITPLHCAAKFGHVSIVVSLIANDAMIDAEDKYKNTPLHYAAKSGQALVVHALVEKDAQVKAKNKDCYTPLDLAAMNGHLNAVIAFLEQSVDIIAVRDNGTVLHQAVRGNNETIVRLLVDRVTSGAERSHFLNVTDSDGDTCLVWAVVEGNLNVATLLLDFGVNVDAQNKRDMTALHWAVQENNLEFVKLLIDRKASKTITGSVNKTALDIAKGKGYREIAEFLEPRAEIVKLFQRFWRTFVSHVWK